MASQVNSTTNTATGDLSQKIDIDTVSKRIANIMLGALIAVGAYFLMILFPLGATARSIEVVDGIFYGLIPATLLGGLVGACIPVEKKI